VSPRRTLLRLLPLLVVAALVFGGCDAFDSPHNTFNPAGDVADRQANLFLLAMWPALAILILVEGLIVYMMFRFARRRADEPLPKQVHGNTALELGWTVAPAILLAVVAVPTLAAIVDLGRQPKDDAFVVEVEGVQWAWFFTYPGLVNADGEPIQTNTEMHIPVGQEIGVRVTSPDVIHSFWVPRLAGKIDAIPGRTNRIWIKADEPGTFEGQCAEFCGKGHAEMRLTLVAHSAEDWQAWIEEQGATVAPPEGEDGQPQGDATPAAGAQAGAQE
jgi:cytochrome c oxidase subunit 2